MFSKTVVLVSLLAASTYAAEFSVMDSSFDAMLRRQGAYYPTSHNCGSGATCAEACGAGYETCLDAEVLHCYDPSVGETCCPDGSGHSCSAGYFCSSDNVGNTYCCPEGMSLSDCGAAYSLTVALVSETGTVAAPTGTAAASTTAAAASSGVYTSASLIHVSPTTAATATTKVVPIGNATVSTSTPAQFTGAAAAHGLAGAVMAVGMAGVIAAL